jgi:hypothetical protein
MADWQILLIMAAATVVLRGYLELCDRVRS